MNITGVDFKLLEFNPTHIPDIGSWFLLKASYCDEYDECNEKSPCDECLKMCNRFVISAKHRTSNGHMFFFNGGLCNRNGGSILDNTRCSVLVDNKQDSICKENHFYINYISEVMFINLPATFANIFIELKEKGEI